jgi:hypothetical protein
MSAALFLAALFVTGVSFVLTWEHPANVILLALFTVLSAIYLEKNDA